MIMIGWPNGLRKTPLHFSQGLKLIVKVLPPRSRSAADRGEYRQAAGAIAKGLMRGLPYAAE